MATPLEPCRRLRPGDTHTIAEFIAALNEGPASATLHVGFEVQMGPNVRVFDGDDRMVVRLPPEAQPFGSGLVWEIDVFGEHQPELRPTGPPPQQTVSPWEDSIRDDPDRLDEYVRAATEYLKIGAPTATITTARPIDLDLLPSDTPDTPDQ